VTEAVLFDAAGTLLYVHPSAGKVYADVAEAFGVHVTESELEPAFRETFRRRRPAEAQPSLMTSEELERQWWYMTVDDVFTTAGKRLEFGDRFDDFFETLFDVFAEPHVWRFYDDVEAALGALKTRGMKCGIVSNWDGRLHRLIGRWGMAEQFDVVLTSAECGRRKPDPLPFQAALKCLGVSPERTLYVGDSYDDDAVGAQRAGLRPVLIDRNSTEGPRDVPHIASLTELAHHL